MHCQGVLPVMYLLPFHSYHCNKGSVNGILNLNIISKILTDDEFLSVGSDTLCGGYSFVGFWNFCPKQLVNSRLQSNVWIRQISGNREELYAKLNGPGYPLCT